MENLQAAIEALLFVVDEPISRQRLYELFSGVEGAEIEAALESLKRRYDDDNSGIILREIAGGFQFATRQAFDEHIRNYLRVKRRSQLSRQALETLAIVAYEQPITIPEIREIRGLDPSGVVKTLLERKMIKIVGRKDVVGRPFMYRTTDEFLIHFGLRNLDDLPKPEEFVELIGESLSEDSLPETAWAVEWGEDDSPTED